MFSCFPASIESSQHPDSRLVCGYCTMGFQGTAAAAGEVSFQWQRPKICKDSAAALVVFKVYETQQTQKEMGLFCAEGVLVLR